MNNINLNNKIRLASVKYAPNFGSSGTKSINYTEMTPDEYCRSLMRPKKSSDGVWGKLLSKFGFSKNKSDDKRVLSEEKKLSDKSCLKENDSLSLNIVGEESVTEDNADILLNYEFGTVKDTELNGKHISLKNIDGEKTDCELTVKKQSDGFERIEAVDEEGKICGFVTVKKVSEDDFKSFCPDELKEYLAGGSALYEERMYSGKRGFGLGTELHNAVRERSKELGCENKIFLVAGWGSHPFHYKSGFRAASDEINSEIESAVSSPVSEFNEELYDIPAVNMYLKIDEMQ